MAEVFALKAIDHDNVATVFTNDVKAGMIANVADKKGHHFEIKLLSDVPYGHKIAVTSKKAKRSLNMVRPSVPHPKTLLPVIMSISTIWTASADAVIWKEEQYNGLYIQRLSPS